MSLNVLPTRTILIIMMTASRIFCATSDARLAEAAKNGDLPAVTTLLRVGADVNGTLGDGATAVAWAVHKDSLEALRLLIRASANVNAADDYGVSPLHLASQNGNLAVAEMLLRAGADPSAVSSSGETVLMTASRTGNLGIVKLLLAHKVDVNAAESKRGQTALMWAVSENHSDIVRELIAHGANAQAHTKSGFTTLMFAARHGNLDIGGALLAAGAKINDSTSKVGTALVVASASGHEVFATLLLEKGADPNAANAEGLTSLHYAILRGLSYGRGVGWYPSNTYLFRKNLPGLVKSLLAHGANPNARIQKNPEIPGGRGLPGVSIVGGTPYVLAAASYDAELMRTLVAAGADPNVVTEGGSPALLFAAGLAEGINYVPLRTEEDDRKSFDAVKVAVELGNDVNAVNSYHQTALHGAAYVGSDSIVRFLVSRGAKVNVKDNSGQTPLSIAGCEFPPTLVDDNVRPQFIHKTTVDLLSKLGAIPLPWPNL